MKNHYQILIVGGGNAGISIAAQLLIKNAKLDIAIIDPSDKHYYQPAWTLVGAGAYDIEKTVRNQQDFIPNKVCWIKDRVNAFDPSQNKVICISNILYTYDYLVVCPGIQLDWYKIKGLKEYLGEYGVCSNYSFESAPHTWKVLKGIRGGKALFTAPNTPIKCGGAPQKIMYLAADFLRKENLLSQTEVHFYSGGTKLFGVDKYASALEKVVDRYGIKTHFYHNLVAIDGPNQLAYFDVVMPNGEKNGILQSFDMLHVTPPQSAPDFIKNSPLAMTDNEFGWLDIHKETLQHTRYHNIFGCGDVGSTHNAKTGAAIRKQAPILVKNLILRMNGEYLNGKYNGYASCPLVTGYGKVILAEFDYENRPLETFPFNQAKERYSMWLLKTKLLPWMYWNKILKGKA